MGSTVIVPELIKQGESGETESPAIATQRERVALIRRAIERETQRGVTDLEVHISGSEVLLKGRCKTYYVKQKAQHAAMLLHRHGSLVNRIHVH